MPRATDFHPWAFGLMLLLAAGPAWPQAVRPARDDPGNWVLQCPAPESGPCVLRHRDWILQPGESGATTALEIQRRGDALVPVVTMRGMPLAAALGGALVVSFDITLIFDGGSPIGMRCGSSGRYFACAPEPGSVPAASAQMLHARSVTLDYRLVVPGLIGGPAQRVTLDLLGLQPALARLLAAGQPDGESLPAQGGLDIRGFADAILALCGVAGGMAEAAPALLAFIAKRFQP